jgi:hypothetical protein
LSLAGRCTDFAGTAPSDALPRGRRLRGRQNGHPLHQRSRSASPLAWRNARKSGGAPPDILLPRGATRRSHYRPNHLVPLEPCRGFPPPGRTTTIPPAPAGTPVPAAPSSGAGMVVAPPKARAVRDGPRTIIIRAPAPGGHDPVPADGWSVDVDVGLVVCCNRADIPGQPGPTAAIEVHPLSVACWRLRSVRGDDDCRSRGGTRCLPLHLNAGEGGLRGVRGRDHGRGLGKRRAVRRGRHNGPRAGTGGWRHGRRDGRVLSPSGGNPKRNSGAHGAGHPHLHSARHDITFTHEDNPSWRRCISLPYF